VSTEGTRVQSGLVRPFVLTGGRTVSARPGLRWETLVEVVPEWHGTVPSASTLLASPVSERVPDLAASSPGEGYELTSEQMALLELSAEPISVAELSAALRLPAQVVAIIVGDLLEAGAVQIHQTDPVEIELSALTRMIERVRSL
jgi:Protein of unknown function (DUF742)